MDLFTIFVNLVVAIILDITVTTIHYLTFGEIAVMQLRVKP